MLRFLPPFLRGLSARLLVHTILFVMACEVLFFVPSLARSRLSYLDSHVAAARLAVVALEATPDNVVSQPIAEQLLERVGALGIVLHKQNDMTLMIDSAMPPSVDAVFDLRQGGFVSSVREAFVTMFGSGDRVLRVLGASPNEPASTVEVLLREQPLRKSMWAVALRILDMSIFISVGTAILVFLSLQYFLVRPMRRITGAMMAFRADPEDASRIIVASSRNDEIGAAQRELATMQETVREALRQQARLAALGTAVTKINHDLRGILSTARLVSDGLADSAAPEVRRVAPTLLAAIDRAVALCTRTLDFTRERPATLDRRRFALATLVDEIAEALVPARPGGAQLPEPHLANEVPRNLAVEADRDQLYRVLFNLCQNAFEAGAQQITLRVLPQDGQIAVEIADDGPGLAPKARANLFQPFTGSARRGGTGLGLAIAREIMRAHGGDIALVVSGAQGTVFRLNLPAPPVVTELPDAEPRPRFPSTADPLVEGARRQA
jgi:signal transduction histidine kinase